MLPMKEKTESEILTWFDDIIKFMSADIREEFKSFILDGRH